MHYLVNYRYYKVVRAAMRIHQMWIQMFWHTHLLILSQQSSHYMMSWLQSAMVSNNLRSVELISLKPYINTLERLKNRKSMTSLITERKVNIIVLHKSSQTEIIKRSVVQGREIMLIYTVMMMTWLILLTLKTLILLEISRGSIQKFTRKLLN